MQRTGALAIVGLFLAASAQAQVVSLKDQQPNTWVKRSPLMDAPVSPSLGYEGSLGYDPKAKLVIRWAGHNQGGGGEQNAETWTFDPITAKWTLKEPNTSPPGACCNAQNLFDPVGGRFLRFPAFSGSHGWHWFRENYLNNSSVWTYDLATNTWRDMRPVPTPRPAPLRCASWDSDHQVAVVFGGEGAHDGTIVYDPYTNEWARMSPKNPPPDRSAGTMAYDKVLKKHILFGTQFTNDPHTWAYDLPKNEWTDLKPAVQPPTDKNDAVLAYDEHNKVTVASIRVFGQTTSAEEWHYETWVYDSAKNTWKKMNPNVEPPGGGQRRRLMVAIPDLNVILMENYVNPTQKVAGVDREQQMWTYRYAESKAKLAPTPVKARKQPRLVEDVNAMVMGPARVLLIWPAAKEADVVGYHLERAPVEVFSEDQIVRLRKDTKPLDEPSVGAIKSIGKFERITKEPINDNKFIDGVIDLTKPIAVKDEIYLHRFGKEQIHAEGKPYRYAVYAYRVRAVNKLGVESGPGPYALTIPSAPQHVFAKEDGVKCQLKWEAHPGAKSYRVYRMESPRINGAGQPVTRLTSDPVKDSAFLDTNVNKDTRRYWIVAVDALGQEGYPSAPVWFERQYKKYYLPFTGEWHQ
ncbi:MAG: hypothetical protein HY289_04830 [Planctomycetes bacterium]|nr:hypothetical protein [Planctomycetota bacterium]